MQTSKLKFYTSFLCPYCKPVEYFLKSNKNNHELVKLDLINNETATEEYRKINPFETVPAIIENDFILWESNTILKYLCNSNEVADHWYPKDPKKRARVDLFIDFYIQRSWDLTRYNYSKLGYASDSLEKAKEVSDSAFADLENVFLSRTKFLASNDLPTICDISFLWHLAGLSDSGYQFSKRVQEYYELVLNTDSKALNESINSFFEERKEGMRRRNEKMKGK